MIVTNAVIFLICLHVTSPCKYGSGKSKALSELYKSVRPRENYTNCCKQVAEKIAKDAMPGCEEQCLQCIIDREQDKTVITDFCLNLGCSSQYWCGGQKIYTEFLCHKCKNLVEDSCGLKTDQNSTYCNDRKRRDTEDEDEYEDERDKKRSSSVRESHKTTSKEKKQLIDAKNTLESAFFSLSSAIRTGKSEVSQEQTDDTEADIDSGMIIEIVQTASGAGVMIGLVAFLYKVRNRVNSIIHRTIPKSRFPAPMPPMQQMNTYSQMQIPYGLATQNNAAQTSLYNPTTAATAQNAQSQMQAPATQQNQLLAIPSNTSLAAAANTGFQNLHEKWKPAAAST